mmetsp:Transcript_360/g.748  ORF Transcript_360/g.748 Transcript_360/m.748 type:complete len:251 (-) Transcript_360:1466-2218(-)
MRLSHLSVTLPPYWMSPTRKRSGCQDTSLVLRVSLSCNTFCSTRRAAWRSVCPWSNLLANPMAPKERRSCSTACRKDVTKSSMRHSGVPTASTTSCVREAYVRLSEALMPLGASFATRTDIWRMPRGNSSWGWEVIQRRKRGSIVSSLAMLPCKVSRKGMDMCAFCSSTQLPMEMPVSMALRATMFCPSPIDTLRTSFLSRLARPSTASASSDPGVMMHTKGVLSVLSAKALSILSGTVWSKRSPSTLCT